MTENQNPEPIWCLIANAVEEHRYGADSSEKRHGLKHFPAGAKLYCFPPLWGDGYEKIKVIGHHRGSHRYVTMVVRSDWLTNWRAAMVYSAYVIAEITPYWDGTLESKRRAQTLALSKRSRQRLNENIEVLYNIFSRYPKPEHVEGCPHCVGDAETTCLSVGKLRQFTTNDLDRYAFKAMTTWGTESDFKYFLPRLLDLMAQHYSFLTDTETIFGNLNYAQWHTWPQDEQEILHTFLLSWWYHTLTGFPTNITGETFLGCISQIVDNITPYLSIWLELCAETLTPLRHLAQFINDNFDVLVKGMSSRFRLEHVQQINAWLLNPAIIEALEKAFFEYSAESFAKDLSDAIEKLGWLRVVQNKPERIT